jgi:hypothetical protein
MKSDRELIEQAKTGTAPTTARRNPQAGGAVGPLDQEKSGPKVRSTESVDLVELGLKAKGK